MRKTILLAVLLLSVSLFAQINEIKNFPYPVTSSTYYTSSILQFNNNYYMFFYDSVSPGFVKLAVSKSTDGTQWSTPMALADSLAYDNIISVASAVFKNKIVVLFRGPDHKPNLITSEDGTTFTAPVDVALGSILASATSKNLYIFPTADTLYVTSGGIYLTTTADLVTWKYVPMPSAIINPCVIPISATNKAVIYETTDNKIMLFNFDGTHYNGPVSLIPADMKGYLPRAAKGSDGSYYVVFTTLNNTSYNITQRDIAYIKSTDNMATWSQPVMVTSFKGFDYLSSVMSGTPDPVITFFSDRPFFGTDKKPGLSYCSLTSADPEAASPLLLWQNAYVSNRGRTLNIQALFLYTQPGDIIYVKAKKYLSTDSVTLYDDGLHGDSLANDNIWGNLINIRPGETITYTYSVKRNTQTGETASFTIVNLLNPDIYSNFMFDVNKFKLPMNNLGVLGDVVINGTAGGLYDGDVVLFSGGFYLSAVTPDQRIATAVASASRVQDYLPGRVDAQVSDPYPDIFVVKNSDPAFSESWIKWKDAVTLGADFYDGDGNNIYNPVDINNNGQWDANEDKPLIIGDLTAWCVYNDYVPASLRMYKDVDPQGIEIQQTIFASHTNDGLNNNTVYARYKIINKSYKAQQLDSVYFSMWADPDLGDPYDDLVGCDTLLNSGLIYNSGSDARFGVSTPAIMFTILQGPQKYIPGITFQDNNSNGIYDEGTDTPLDTAYAKLGSVMGVKKYPGAKNLGMTSFVHYMASNPTLGDPMNTYEQINYQHGNDKMGNGINPCTWVLGQVTGGVNCSEVNNKYWYSGDPVERIGWLNNYPTDQRTVVNSGPFTLPYGKSVDIITAYNIGRGTDSLNSITEARNIARNSREMWKSNFSGLPLAVNDDNNAVKEYRLGQNYPNPFNPATTIEFMIPSREKVSLRIYDILGRELAVLVNEIKEAGSHKVNFNASKLASGVYFYKLESGTFTQTRKLMLVK